MMVNTWTPTKEQLKAATPKRIRQQRAPGNCVQWTPKEVPNLSTQKEPKSGSLTARPTKWQSHTEELDRSKWLAEEEEARCPGVW